MNRPVCALGIADRGTCHFEALGSLPIILPLRYPRTPDVSTISKAENVDLKELMAWEQAPTNPRRLEQAGVKGMVRGGARVADYHANLIYNAGDDVGANFGVTQVEEQSLKFFRAADTR